jgi:hypothetical protein
MDYAYNDNPDAVGDYVTIKADGDNRHSRAARIVSGAKRYEAQHKVSLSLIHKSYSETHGFLSQSSFRYRINRK